MKYLKYSLSALLIAGVFSVSAATLSNTGYSFYVHTFSTGKSTLTLPTAIKTETNYQRIESYSSSEISVSGKIYNGTDYTASRTIAPGSTVVYKSASDQAIAGLPGSYTAKLSKTSVTLTSKHIGGAWWLDQSYYDATH